MLMLFNEILQLLAISHVTFSPYHPESQGVLAVREVVQEFLGFSRAELVFGHLVQDPLKMLKDRMLSVPDVKLV